jgi:hypothetical protein
MKVRLGAVEHENGWQLAEWIGETTPDGAQHLLERAQRDTNAARDVLKPTMHKARPDDNPVTVQTIRICRK